MFIADEIQCGLGRTGRFFAFQKYGLQPDVVLVAKPLAAGLPLAAIIARDAAAQAFSPGMHGTTFGGGPLQCRLALKFLEIIERPGFLDRVRQVGVYFRRQLEKLQGELRVIREVRGEGLMVAAELASHCPARVSRLILISPFGLWNDAYPVTDPFTLMYVELPALLYADPSILTIEPGDGALAQPPSLVEQQEPAEAVTLPPAPPAASEPVVARQEADFAGVHASPSVRRTARELRDIEYHLL